MKFITLSIILLHFSISSTSSIEKKFYSFGIRGSYSENEKIHSCADNTFESCNKEAIDKISMDIINNHDHTVIEKNLKKYETTRLLCLRETNLEFNECYATIYHMLKSHVENATLSKDDYMTKTFKMMKECSETNDKCRTSTFVVNNIRTCVNDAITDFYKEVYSGIKGGQAAKTDVIQALVSLQQQTIENKVELTSSLEYLNHLDLVMDRLTFCSEMINKIEAVGI